ncbi:hypothetical protein A2U01_0095705, partial [Trifolium medium]|nr:hypothetical protein [Trifolium medium]
WQRKQSWWRGVLINPKGERRWCGREGLGTTGAEATSWKKTIGFGGGQ